MVPLTMDPITSADKEEFKLHWDSDKHAFFPQCRDKYPCKNCLEDKIPTLKCKH